MSRLTNTTSSLLLCCVAVQAAASTTAEPAKVEVKAKAEDYDPRRDDTAGKTVMRREEIMKYGDTSVYDVLKRAPGVTVVDNTIRMRGLAGYTQVLVNGQSPPPGFSLDALAPDQIERIEIIRAASAEFSMQAIAGTVNIVLKQTVTKAESSLRLNASRADEKRTQFVNASLADKQGSLSWSVNGMLQHNHLAQPNLQTDRYTATDGSVAQLRDSQGNLDLGNVIAGLQPSLNWKLSADDQLSVTVFLQRARGSSDHATTTEDRIGVFPTPDYIHILGRRDFSIRYANVEVNYVAKLWGGKLDAKAALTDLGLHSQAEWLSATAGYATRFLRRDVDQRDAWRLGTSGKYTRSLFDGHAMAAGWEFNGNANRDDNHRVEGFIGAVPADIPERFDPHVRQLAVFAQDEWNVTPQWSMYLGARWEGIRTESRGTGLLDTVSNTHVLTPVAQTLYKFPDKSGRQLRLALTQTFKAPDQSQLSARRYYADLNTRFLPDKTGNPALRPELARGIDLTYEHFWAPGAVYSLGTSVRRIRDTIHDALSQDANGQWVVRPINQGNAHVRTLDFDAKFPLKAVMRDGAPPVDLHVNLDRNWSRVDTVPGPDNRLDQQIPFSATFGADYKKDAFGYGVNVAYRAGGDVRISQAQSTRLQARRDVDAYVKYAPSKAVDLRLSVANALGTDTLGYSRYQDASGTTETWTRRPASPEVRLNVGVKW